MAKRVASERLGLLLIRERSHTTLSDVYVLPIMFPPCRGPDILGNGCTTRL